MCVLKPRRRIERRDAGRACVFRRECRVRHLAGPARPNPGNADRQYPVYDSVHEGLDHRHRFDCGVVYLPLPARAMVLPTDPRQSRPEEGLHRYRRSRSRARADPRHGAGETASISSAAIASVSPTRDQVRIGGDSAMTVPANIAQGLDCHLFGPGNFTSTMATISAWQARGSATLNSSERTSIYTSPRPVRVFLHNDARSKAGCSMRNRWLLRSRRRATKPVFACVVGAGNLASARSGTRAHGVARRRAVKERRFIEKSA